MYRIVVLLLTSCVFGVLAGDPNCPEGWLSLNTTKNATNSNKCAHYSKRRFNFTAAQDYCRRNLNSNLMTIRSRQENREISKLLFEELKFDESFWLNGRVISSNGSFIWLNDDCSPNYSNFHTNNHDFNVNELDTEYLVLSSALNENSHSKKKERGTWCSFRPQIMFVALCEHHLPGGGRSNFDDCKISQSIGDLPAGDGLKQNPLLDELLHPARSFGEITKTQAYFIVASSLMIILLIGMCLILRAKLASSRTAPNDNVNPFNEAEMY